MRDRRAPNQSEPGNLAEWARSKDPAAAGSLYTCARPGRVTYDRKRVLIDDDTIDRWTHGLPDPRPLHIVSLLGSKRDGFSEFGYYPFRSEKETNPKPSFQEWLDSRYGPGLVVHEVPTVDAQAIPDDILEATTSLVVSLTKLGSTVLVVDSAGSVRSARVCIAAGFIPQ